jgi:hypothetical protein
MHCYVCRKAGPDIAGKTKFITGKKLKRESPVYHNKTKNLKHLCFNVVVVNKFLLANKRMLLAIIRTIYLQ